MTLTTANVAQSPEAAASTAEMLAETFNRDHSSHELRPHLEPTLTVGGDDQPLFVFTLGVALDADFDPRQDPFGPIDDLVGRSPTHRVIAR